MRHPSWLCHFISNSCPELQAASPSEIWGCRGGINLLCGFLLRGCRLPPPKTTLTSREKGNEGEGKRRNMNE